MKTTILRIRSSLTWRGTGRLTHYTNGFEPNRHTALSTTLASALLVDSNAACDDVSGGRVVV